MTTAALRPESPEARTNVQGEKALKVLIANDTYPPQLNGAAVATHRLVHGLAERGHFVSVVAPSMAYRDEEQSDPSSPNVTVHRIKSIPTKPLHPEFRITSWAKIDGKLDRICPEFRTGHRSYTEPFRHRPRLFEAGPQTRNPHCGNQPLHAGEPNSILSQATASSDFRRDVETLHAGL